MAGTKVAGGVYEVVVGASGAGEAAARSDGALVGDSTTMVGAGFGFVSVTGTWSTGVLHAMKVARLEPPMVSAKRRITDSFRGPDL
jgi:hypothetical protein